MTSEERAQYDSQVRRRDGAARLLSDALGTVRAFCSSMPLEWTVPSAAAALTIASPNEAGGPASGQQPSPQRPPLPDFATALLHLLREEAGDLQTLSASCLVQLAGRKLDVGTWWGMVENLPGAVRDSNAAAEERNVRGAAVIRAGGNGDGSAAALVRSLPFHRMISRALSQMVVGHLSHVTTDNGIVSGWAVRMLGMAWAE